MQDWLQAEQVLTRRADRFFVRSARIEHRQIDLSDWFTKAESKRWNGGASEKNRSEGRSTANFSGVLGKEFIQRFSSPAII